jgi:hypothetical protein
MKVIYVFIIFVILFLRMNSLCKQDSSVAILMKVSLALQIYGEKPALLSVILNFVFGE